MVHVFHCKLVGSIGKRAFHSGLFLQTDNCWGGVNGCSAQAFKLKVFRFCPKITENFCELTYKDELFTTKVLLANKVIKIIWDFMGTLRLLWLVGVKGYFTADPKNVKGFYLCLLSVRSGLFPA